MTRRIGSFPLYRVLDRLEAFEVLLPLMRGAASGGADVEAEKQMEQAGDDQFRRAPAESDGQVVERGRDEKQAAEERVGSLARKALAKRHRHVLPAPFRFVEDLNVSADALDVHVKRVDRLEAGGEHDERQECRNRKGNCGRRCDRGAGPETKGRRKEDHPHRSALADRGPQSRKFMFLLTHTLVTIASSSTGTVLVLLSPESRTAGL